MIGKPCGGGMGKGKKARWHELDSKSPGANIGRAGESQWTTWLIHGSRMACLFGQGLGGLSNTLSPKRAPDTPAPENGMIRPAYIMSALDSNAAGISFKASSAGVSS